MACIRWIWGIIQVSSAVKWSQFKFMARFSQMAPNLYAHCSIFSFFSVLLNQRNTVSMVVPLVWWTVLLILWILAAVYFYVRSLFDEHPDIYEKWTPVIAGKLERGRFHLDHTNDFDNFYHLISLFSSSSPFTCSGFLFLLYWCNNEFHCNEKWGIS